jgi:predicted ATPase
VVHDRGYPPADDLSQRRGVTAWKKRLREYRLLLEGYPSLGYEVCIVPRIGVSERADFVLNALAE